MNSLALLLSETADHALERVELHIIADEQVLQADGIVDALVHRAKRQHADGQAIRQVRRHTVRFLKIYGASDAFTKSHGIQPGMIH